MTKMMHENKKRGEEMICKHEHVIKAISIPMTDNGRGELDYEELLKIVQKIVSKNTDPGFTWFEVLACIDCNTVLEQNDVFIPDTSNDTFERYGRTWYHTRPSAEKHRQPPDTIVYDESMSAYYIKQKKPFWNF